jgi:hypothetical protein
LGWISLVHFSNSLPLLNKKTDWPVWKFLMSNYLPAKNVFGVVDGERLRDRMLTVLLLLHGTTMKQKQSTFWVEL